MTRGFDPFREMDRFLGEVTRIPTTSVMPMDLYRDADTFVARIDLPGVDPASIDIDVEDRTLTVRAERAAEGPTDPRQWLARERTSGTFARQLSLGNGLALDRIEAEYRDGVLSLTIPVAEQSKPRKVQVTHVGAAQTAVASGEAAAGQSDEDRTVAGQVTGEGEQA